MIPVLWITNAPNTIARGYWDQGLLEALFANDVWSPPGWPEFHHIEWVRTALEADGSLDSSWFVGPIVVVLPARHHANQVKWVNDLLSRFPSVLLVLTGDEDHEFPINELRHPHMKVWQMTPAPNPPWGDRVIGSWWPPGIREEYRKDPEAPYKGLDWFFAGQNTHYQRERCVEALQTLSGGKLVETAGFTQGEPQDEYWWDLAEAIFVPCPAGPCSIDSFRLWETLEAGSIPIVGTRSSAGDEITTLEMMAPGHRIPTLSNWDSLAGMIEGLSPNWLAITNRTFAWWQAYKRQVAYWLRDDLRELGAELEPDEKVTVIITTSPAPIHPSTDHLVETIESVRDVLPNAEILLMFDGVRPEQAELRSAYEQYTREVLWLCNIRWHNVLPVVSTEFVHQAVLTKRALELVETPLVMFVEHDTPLLSERSIDWRTIENRLAGAFDLVRFHHEESIHPEHEHLMLRQHQLGDFLPTVQWSQRPHVATTAFYHRILDTYFGSDSRTMIEDVMHGVVQSYTSRYGHSGWEQFRLAIYAPPEDPVGIKRSTHLDSRSGYPKFDMRFAYNGATPEGAPCPNG